MDKVMEKIEYEKEKEERRGIWIARVFANAMCSTPKQEKALYKEAIEKFENEYPKYNE